MSIVLADDAPEIQQRGARANFRWGLTEPWDERRLAAFLMTKHRRSETDWTRRPSPFFASLGQSFVECSIPLANPESLSEMERLLTIELKGILAGAREVHERMSREPDWRSVSPP